MMGNGKMSNINFMMNKNFSIYREKKNEFSLFLSVDESFVENKSK